MKTAATSFFIVILILLCMFAAALAQGQWSTPVRISEPGDCWYSQILAQGDTLHVIYSNSQDGWKISHISSADGGETWTSYQVLSDTVNTSNTYFPRVIGHNGQLMAVWTAYFLHGVYRFNIGYSASNDNGINWSTPQYILDSNLEWPFYLTAAGADSLVNIIFFWGYADSIYFYITRSTDFGTSWSPAIQILSTAQSGIVDISALDSMIHLTWDGTFMSGRSWDTYYMKSSDGGLTWSQNAALSTIDQHGSQLPSVSLGSRGEVAVAWMDGKYSPYIFTGDILLRQSQDSGTVWMPEKQATFNHYAWASDIVTNGDTIHVVWEDESPGLGRVSIHHTMSIDGGQSWSDPFWLDQTLDDSRYPAMATSNRRVYAIWCDTRDNPDTNICCGLYFTRWQAESDAVENQNGNPLPQGLSLSAYPNPFNSKIIVNYSSSEGGDLRIYDNSGQLVRNFKIEKGGNGNVVWDATDKKGQKVTTGVYFARLLSVGHSRTIKLIYVK